MYSQLDKLIPKLKKKIRLEFNYLSVLPFDEINIISAKAYTEEMFERLLRFSKDEYLKIIKHSVLYAKEVLNGFSAKYKAINEEDFLEYVLSSYNSVTCYLYEKEAQRKRLRLVEEMLTAKEYLQREIYNKSLKRTANLWFTQSLQYGIDVTDKTVLEVYKRNGIKKVVWVSEKDDKVCDKCRKLNGEVFDIDNLPSKAHYNCRCYFVPYKVSEKT